MTIIQGMIEPCWNFPITFRLILWQILTDDLCKVFSISQTYRVESYIQRTILARSIVPRFRIIQQGYGTGTVSEAWNLTGCLAAQSGVMTCECYMVLRARKLDWDLPLCICVSGTSRDHRARPYSAFYPILFPSDRVYVSEYYYSAETEINLHPHQLQVFYKTYATNRLHMPWGCWAVMIEPLLGENGTQYKIHNRRPCLDLGGAGASPIRGRVRVPCEVKSTANLRHIRHISYQMQGRIARICYTLQINLSSTFFFTVKSTDKMEYSIQEDPDGIKTTSVLSQSREDTPDLLSTSQRRTKSGILLVPQPSDDPKDPLVSVHSLSCWTHVCTFLTARSMFRTGLSGRNSLFSPHYVSRDLLPLLRRWLVYLLSHHKQSYTTRASLKCHTR